MPVPHHSRLRDNRVFFIPRQTPTNNRQPPPPLQIHSADSTSTQNGPDTSVLGLRDLQSWYDASSAVSAESNSLFSPELSSTATLNSVTVTTEGVVRRSSSRSTELVHDIYPPPNYSQPPNDIKRTAQNPTSSSIKWWLPSSESAFLQTDTLNISPICSACWCTAERVKCSERCGQIFSNLKIDTGFLRRVHMPN